MGQVRWVWSREKVVWCVGRMGGESEGGARLIRREELTAGPCLVYYDSLIVQTLKNVTHLNCQSLKSLDVV